MRELGGAVAKVASYLHNQGVRRGDPVAIISNTRAEWCVADLAIHSVGGVTVGVYQSLSAAEIAYILHHSGAEHVIAENEEQLNKLLQISQNPTTIPEDERGPKQSVQVELKSILSMEPSEAQIQHTYIEELFAEAPDDELTSPTFNPETSPGDIASLVYTSGTTGTPKGVVQRHENHLANLRQLKAINIIPEDIPNPSIFLYLPLAHSFGRTMAYLALLGRCILQFSSIADHKTSRLDLALISDDLRSASSNIVPTVPRLLEKARAGIIAKSQGAGLLSKLIALTIKFGEVNRSKQAKQTFVDKLGYILTTPLRRLLSRKIFGSNFRFAIIGGAKLPLHVGEFFEAIGIAAYEGYGLTETCVVTNVNTPQFHRLGSIGKVLPEIEVKVAEDGELLFRGPNICSGYWQAPIATAEAWDSDGWFHTGDIGTIDKDGYIFITDRKKELLVTAGGKKIPPQKLEVLIKQHPMISQAVLTGEGRQYCTMLITLNSQLLAEWAGTRSAPPHLNSWAELRQELQKHLNQINSSLPSFESIKNLYILDGDFTIENGLLTPTLKVKRKVITARFEQEIASMYAEKAPSPS